MSTVPNHFYPSLEKGHSAYLDFQIDLEFLSRYFDHFSPIDRAFLVYIQPDELDASVFASCKDSLHPPRYKFGGTPHRFKVV